MSDKKLFPHLIKFNQVTFIIMAWFICRIKYSIAICNTMYVSYYRITHSRCRNLWKSKRHWLLVSRKAHKNSRKLKSVIIQMSRDDPFLCPSVIIPSKIFYTAYKLSSLGSLKLCGVAIWYITVYHVLKFNNIS